MCCEYFRVLYWYIIYCLTDNFIKLIKNLKMKIFATIIAIAAASIAISNDTKGLCLCCLDLQVVCCTLCLLPDTSADVQARVTDSITTIQVFGGPKWTSRTWPLWTENDHLSYFRLDWLKPNAKHAINAQCVIWLVNTAQNVSMATVDVQRRLIIKWKRLFPCSKRSKSDLIIISICFWFKSQVPIVKNFDLKYWN